MAHAADFRQVGGNDETAKHLETDWENADLTPRERVLCEYARKLTLHPSKMTAADLAPLRAVGLTDRDIHDAVQVISYFNYINRIADALGTDLEPEMLAKPDAWGASDSQP